MIKRFLLLSIVALLAVSVKPATPAHAQGNDPYTVIAMVNDIRVQNGLVPYEIDPQLMAAAQQHSAWAASIGTHSHTGPGGTTPRDRAIAAGYGGGEWDVRVSENIYWGSNATSSSAIEWWTNSPIHYAGMTSTNYSEIGAGVVYGEYGGFYTLKFGHVLNGTSPPDGPDVGGGSTGGGVESGPIYNVVPVEVSAPNPDGSIVHLVDEGQNVWDISEGYDVPVSEILALNNLTEDDAIYPGQKLIIYPAPIELPAENLRQGPVYHEVESGQTLGGIAIAYGTTLEDLLTLNNLTEESLILPGDELLISTGDPTPTPNIQPTATLTPWPTPTPTLTPTPNAAAVAEVTMPDEAAAPAEAQQQTQVTPMNGVLLGGLGLVGLAGVGLIISGLFVLREADDDEEETPPED